MTEEHPAARAARMIKELHQQTIDKIDAGFVFTKDDVNVNEQVRAECVKQLAACDEIIARAEGMSQETSIAAAMILADLQDTVKPQDTELPELGNYDHKET